MFRIVGAFTENELVVVTFFVERRGHRLVRFGPAAKTIDDVVCAVLLKNADRFFWRFADQIGIGVSAADVGKAADGAKNLPELIGTFPCNREGADAARARAGNRASCRIVRDLHPFPDFRNHLFEKKMRIGIAE
jgi:hypothetical protein